MVSVRFSRSPFAEEKLAEMTKANEELEEELESVEEQVRDLEAKVESLGDKVEELEETVATLEDEKKALHASLQPHDDLVKALTLFLSWLDHPPAGMSSEGIASHLANFRRDLDYALREVSR